MNIDFHARFDRSIYVNQLVRHIEKSKNCPILKLTK